jgi:c-di-GMP-binding flagellar brake protein YcgR
MKNVNTKADQRRYARFEVLDYAMVYPPNGNEPFRAVVVDVGLGGVQLRSKEQLPVGENFELVIGTPEGKQLALNGEVRSSRKILDSELFGSGYRFIPESHDQRIDIAEYVHMVFQRQGEKLIQE